MSISTSLIKELRSKTGISVAQCKQALEEAGGDLTKAETILKNKGAEIVNKKSDRELGAGMIGAYLHLGGVIGGLVELVSETDFVSHNEDFKALADDLAMHLVAMKPNTIEEFLAQEFVKDPSQKISDLISVATQKFGERVEIGRFHRLAIGE